MQQVSLYAFVIFPIFNELYCFQIHSDFRDLRLSSICVFHVALKIH